LGFNYDPSLINAPGNLDQSSDFAGRRVAKPAAYISCSKWGRFLTGGKLRLDAILSGGNGIGDSQDEQESPWPTELFVSR